MGTNLESTTLSGPRGSVQEIKVGEQVCFINPQVCGGEKSIQESMMKSTIEKLGTDIYEVKKITRYPAVTTLTIEGKEGKTTEMTRTYFCKYN